MQILERGRPIYGFLGIQLQDLDPVTRTALSYEGENGAAVAVVFPDSPAQTAGLRSEDIVLAMNGEKIKTSAQFLAMIQRTKVGEMIRLDVWRDGRSLELNATVTESSAASTPPQTTKNLQSSASAYRPEEVLQAIGIQARELSMRERMRGYRGVVVTGILDHGLAKQKVVEGDLIIAVNQAKISDVNDFFTYLAASAAVQDTGLILIRNGQNVRVVLPVISQ